MDNSSPWMGMQTSQQQNEPVAPVPGGTQRSFGNMRAEYLNPFKHMKKPHTYNVHLPHLKKIGG